MLRVRQKMQVMIMSEWQPIETAPSAERILVWGCDWINIASTHWEENGVPVWFNGDVTLEDITHWMPLPAPPSTDGIGGTDGS